MCPAMLDRKESANGRTWTPASWLDDVVRTLPEKDLPARAGRPPDDPEPPRTEIEGAGAAAALAPVLDERPRRSNAETTARGSLVVVVGAAAGVGKTTMALHLASALVAETAKRVALVDLDLRMGTVAATLGARPDRDVGTALDALELEDDGQLLTHLSWAAGGFQVLPAPPPDPPRTPEPERVAALLHRLVQHYDFVVVDTPPTADAATAAALNAAATVLLLTTPEPRSQHACGMYVAQLGERGFPLEKLKLVLNRARGSGTATGELPIAARIAEDVVGARGGWRDGSGELARSVRAFVDLLWRPPAPPAPPPSPGETAKPVPGARPAPPMPVLLGGGAAVVVAAGMAAYLLLGRGEPAAATSAAPTAQPAAASPTVARVEPTATSQPVPTATRPAVPTAAAAVAAPPTVAPTAQPATPAAVPTAAPAKLTPPPAPTAPPRTLFDERFVDNARRWPSDQRSTAWLANGVYRLAARTPGKFVAVTPGDGPKLRDAAVTASFRKTGGVAGGGYGIVLRSQGALDGVSQGGRYYVFEVGDKGEVGAWRREGDRWVDLLPWTASAAAKAGEEANRLTALALGSRLTFMVNDQVVANLEDAELKEGQVGVFVGGDGNQVALERFQVQAAD